MKRAAFLFFLVFFLVFFPALLWAQITPLKKGAPPPASWYSTIPLCYAGEGLNSKALTCTSGTGLDVSPTIAEAAFATLTQVTPANINAAYALAVDLPDATRIVWLDNQTDGDVVVSFDGGVTTHFALKAGDVYSIPLAANGLKSTGAIHLKDGTTACTVGTFNISSVK